MYGLKKVLRDFQASWGRTLTLVLVLALGATVFAATFGAYGVLSREIRRAYVETQPASATLELSDVSVETLQRVRARPDIAVATRRATLHGRFRTSSERPWGTALIFVADDFAHMPLAKLRHERGADNPASDTVLIERSALPVLGGDIGTTFELTLPGGPVQTVAVSGVVHEAALAPAHTHACVYLYVSPTLVAKLGAPTAFDEVRILVAEGADDVTSIERTAQQLGKWITDQGLGQVHQIRIPPPGKHPHQSQMTAVLSLLLVFAGLVFFMSALLAAAMLGALLSRQVRELGVLKTLGATSSMLGRWYVVAMTLLAAAAVGLAWVPARLGVNAWSLAVSRLLNFDLQDDAVPTWVSAVTLGATLSIPLLVTLPGILRATRAPVTVTLQDFGLGRRGPSDGAGFGERLGRRITASSRTLAYALRNVVRLRRKLALSVALFAASGGITIAAVSVADSWQAWSVRLRAEQVYDLEVGLADIAMLDDTAILDDRATRDDTEIRDDTTNLDEARRRVAQLPSVDVVEAWLSIPTAWAQPGALAVQRTYPDDAHGAFTLLAPPPGTSMLRVTVTDGEWLSPNDVDGLVLNQMVRGQAAIPIGARVTLAVEGEARSFRVVGKIEQVGVGAMAYVNPSALTDGAALGARLRPHVEMVGVGARLRVKAKSATDLAGLVSDVESALSASHAKIEEIVPLGVYENAMVAHFEILVRALFALAALTALVGTLGLGSTVAVSVIERTRELGVIRAMGGSAAQVRNLVLTEGAIVGGVSLIFAVGLGISLAWGLGSVIGRMSFALSLPLTPSVAAIGAWALTVVCLSALASLLPARRAARITVREAVNHV